MDAKAAVDWLFWPQQSAGVAANWNAATTLLSHAGIIGVGPALIGTQILISQAPNQWLSTSSQ
jgi:hypothetical protein